MNVRRYIHIYIDIKSIVAISYKFVSYWTIISIPIDSGVRSLVSYTNWSRGLQQRQLVMSMTSIALFQSLLYLL